jgi:hypothetical protein
MYGGRNKKDVSKISYRSINSDLKNVIGR